MGIFGKLFGGGTVNRAADLTGQAMKCVEKRKFGKAAELLNEAIGIDPGYGIAYNELAFIHSRMLNDLNSADTYAQKAMTCEPCNPEFFNTLNGIHLAIARRLNSKDEIKSAMAARLQELEAILQANPDYPPAHLIKASALALSGEPEEVWESEIELAEKLYASGGMSSDGSQVSPEAISAIITSGREMCEGMMRRWEKTK